jgi:hypothetical protein
MRLAMFGPIKHDQSNVYLCIKLVFSAMHPFYEQRERQTGGSAPLFKRVVGAMKSGERNGGSCVYVTQGK